MKMKTITIITTYLSSLGHSFRKCCDINDKEKINLYNFYHPICNSISYEDWNSNTKAVEWFQLNIETIIKNAPPYIKNKIKKNCVDETNWENTYDVIKEVGIQTKDFPLYDNIAVFNQIYEDKRNTDSDKLYILPVFKNPSMQNSEKYIDTFKKIAKELSGETSDFRLLVCFHASDFISDEKEKIGFCIYKKKADSKITNDNTEIWFFSHVDNEIKQYLQGSNQYTASDLFKEETYRLPKIIDEPLSKEDSEIGTIAREILEIITEKISK